MATTKVAQVRGYGPEASLPSEIVEGQLLYSSDTAKEFLDTNNTRIRMNPTGNWKERNPHDPDFIANAPDIEALLREIDFGRKEVGGVKLYGVLWDKTSSAMRRLYDSASITTDTTNFVYSGSVNESYDNPFDDIYPWSECKQCNVDLDLYRAQVAGDDILDCITAWYGDPDFATDGSNGFVGRYTPEFWYYGYENNRGKFVLIADGEVEGFLHHKPSIRSHGFAVDDGNDGVTSNDGQPLTNVAISSIHSKATAGGMTLEDIYELDSHVALYMVEFASTDAQSKLGNGCSSCSYEPTFTVLEAETGATSLLLPIAGKAHYIPGATIDFSTTKGGVVRANRRTIVSSMDYGVQYCQVTLDSPIDLTTDLYPSIHGKNNADSIGNKSGYIGFNGKNNAWYRGEILYGNRYRYILGVYRQTGTNHLWLCDPDTTGNYDALNTTDHIDTGIVQYTPASASWQSVKNYGVPEGKLASIGMITEAGAITGDQQYCPLTTTGNTVALSGGSARSGADCGVLCFAWTNASSYSVWSFAGALLLKSK